MVTIVLSYYGTNFRFRRILDSIKKLCRVLESKRARLAQYRPTSMRPFGVFWLTGGRPHMSAPVNSELLVATADRLQYPSASGRNGPSLTIEITLGWRNGPLLSTHTDDGDGEYWVYIIYWTTNDSKCTFRQKASRAMKICHKHYYMPADPCTAHRCYKIP